MGTIGIRFDADCLIVFAEYDSRLVFGDVFGTHVRVHGNVFATVRVVGVFVVAHVDQLARIDECMVRRVVRLVEYVFLRMVLTEGRRDEWRGSYDKRYILQESWIRLPRVVRSGS